MRHDGIARWMGSIENVPGMAPDAVAGLFEDDFAAEKAIRELLLAGFNESQISLIPKNAEEHTPANDPSTYRATGLRNSPSRQDRDHAPVMSEGSGGNSAGTKYATVLVRPMRKGEASSIRRILKHAGGELAQDTQRDVA
jgi:hypothetical protein